MNSPGAKPKSRKEIAFWFGVGFLVLLVVFAILGPLIRHDPLVPVSKPFLMPSGLHWLGTDEQGRDVFARLAYGARISLVVGFTVQILSLLVGVTVGLLGVFAPRWIGMPLMRFADGMFAFPDILLAILIIGVWSMGLVPVIVALAITAWPAVARLVYTQALSLKDREYVVASQAMGAKTTYRVVRHVLPHLTGLLMAVAMVDLAGTILAESALSFLGIGVQAPQPSWGSMINIARLDMQSNPQLLVWPCVILCLTIFALNFVGDGLRARLDPKRAD
ncbi:MAG TPA: ABC transporter permease [Fimbriimonadaceae bacterium]|nr:ABC transporter permease [Fimbriimonadaceae bacterium]HRJ33209.1 ABC transporter permease [Fimbriimonadaceae bacterium]